MEAALKHADGEKDEDVVPWKAMLINNWKEKNNDLERRASEANSSLTEREALEMLRDTLKKAREKYCKMVEEEMG